jgi:hypothetical protein
MWTNGLALDELHNHHEFALVSESGMKRRYIRVIEAG